LRELELCVLCGGPKSGFRPFMEKSGYKIVRCAACSLVFVNPRDEAAALLSQYGDNRSSPAAYYEATAGEDRQNALKILEIVNKHCGKGEILDVGCNVGTFLESARDKGWKPQGVDANPQAIAACAKKGIRAAKGFFGEEKIAELDRQTFDLISMNDTLEHFQDPKEVLRQAGAHLKPGGGISLLTPNLESFLARMFQIKPKEHLFYFSLATLSKMLQETGFKVLHAAEWSRRRNVGAMHLGASFENPLWASVSKFLQISRLDGIVNVALEAMFREQIYILAKKA